MYNQLVLHQDPEKSKYDFFLKHKEETVPIITDEQLMAEEVAQNEQQFSRMFFGGAGASMTDVRNLYAPKLAELRQKIPTVPVKEENLPVETVDPFHTKAYEESKVVFARQNAIPMFADDGYQPSPAPAGSQSNDWVKQPGSYSGAASRTTAWDGVRPTTDTGYNRTSTAGTAAPVPPRATPLFDHIPRVAQNFQNVAYTTPVWNEKNAAKGWERWGEKSLWQRIKGFFKSKKGRVMIKLTCLVTLQLGMALIGKKYSIDGLGQGAMFIGMMLGTFYITKELQSDGFDIRGFQI